MESERLEDMRAKTAQCGVTLSHPVVMGAGVVMGSLLLSIASIDLRAGEYAAWIVPTIGTVVFYTSDRSGSERALRELNCKLLPVGEPSLTRDTVASINAWIPQCRGVSS